MSPQPDITVKKRGEKKGNHRVNINIFSLKITCQVAIG